MNYSPTMDQFQGRRQSANFGGVFEAQKKSMSSAQQKKNQMTQLCSICTKEFKNVKTHLRMSKCGKTVPVMESPEIAQEPEIEQVDSAPIIEQPEIMHSAEPIEYPAVIAQEDQIIAESSLVNGPVFVEIAAVVSTIGPSVAIQTDAEIAQDAESVNVDTQINNLNCPNCSSVRDSESVATIKSLKQEIADKDRQLDQVTDSKQYRQLSYNKIVQVEQIADLTFIDISFDKANGILGLIQTQNGSEIISLNSVPLFNDYARIPVDIYNRIVPNTLGVTNKKSYFDYKFDYKVSHYGHCQKNYQGIMSKILLENDFKMAQVKPKMVYWDIETYTTPESAKFGMVPKPEDNHAHISMICVVIDKHVYAFTLNKYKATQKAIDAKLKQHTGVDGYMVNITCCTDEINMCWEFLHQLKKLAETQPIIVCGYNATQGRPQFIDQYTKKPKCYDMDFIISKLKIKHQDMLQTRASFDNKSDDQAYSAISWMPFVQFIDFKSMVQPALKTEDRLEKLKNQKLDSILELFEIQQKISVDHSLFNLASNQAGFDMSEYIAYCIYDCICLGLVVDRHNLLDLKYQMATDSKTPISAISFMSDAQKITYTLMREYNPDYMFSYSYIKYDNSIDKKIEGAYTKTVDKEELLFKVLHCMASDFTSQYPSNMILLNICSTTLAAEDAEDVSEIDINAYTGKDPRIIKFIKYVNKPSKISNLIKKWFFEKEYYKKDHPENGHFKDLTRSNIAKIKINTIYGLLGQSSSPLFKYELASAVTAMGRTLLHGYTDFVQNEIKLPENEKYQVVSCDTDEIIIVKSRGDIPSVPFNEGETDSILKALHSDVYKYMLDKYKLNLDQGDHYKLLMESETPQYIFNKNKKCYIKYGWDSKSKSMKLKQKGVGSKTNRSKLLDHKINEFFVDCFIKPVDGLNDAKTRISEFKSKLRADINLLKQNQGNLSDYCLLHRFTKSVNSSGKLTKSGYLEQQHGYKSLYKVVPYNTGLDQIDYQWVEYHPELDLSKLQTSRLVDLLVAPITCFFNDKVNAYEVDEEDMQDYIDDYEYVLIRYEPANKAEWVRANQLESIVKASKTQIIHEIIKRPASKLYIDIDIKANNAGFLPTFNIQDVCSFINRLYRNSFAIYVAQDNTKSKLSYHLIGNSLFHKQQMRALATIINKEFSLERYGISDQICDLLVYDEGKQLRLPLQAKWSKEFNKIDTSRKLKMVGSNNFSDYIITGHTYQQSHYNPFYTIPIQFNGELKKSIITDTIKSKLEASLNITITKIKTNTCMMSPCPICSTPEKKINHDRCPQGLLGEYIRCFKSSKSICVRDILRSAETIEEAQKRNKPKAMIPLDEATIINMKDIIYDINAAKLTFVRSAMGTSKTQCLKRQIAQPEFDNKFIIFVSFRRTFANSVAAELNIKSYLDIEEKGQIHINNEQKRVMIQFDSLHRLNLSEINPREVILVLDEIESILCQCDSFGSKPSVQNSADRLMRLIEESSKVVVLDALLQNNTIKLIKTLAETQNYQIIDNVYKRLNGTAYIMETTTPTILNDRALGHIQELIKEGKKVVVVATGKKFAELVVQSARLVKCGLNIKMYHGEDAKIDPFDTENMATIKHRDFKDVNESWKDVDLLVYTSTLTAGISFNLKRFDTLIGVYAAGTCDVVSFLQATQRVRNFNDCDQYIYVNTKFDYNMKPEYQYSSFEQYINHKTNAYGVLYEPSRRESLQAWIGLRQNNIKWNKITLLKTLLHYQGLKIETREFVSINKAVKEKLVEMAASDELDLQPEDADLHIKAQSNKFLIQSENTLDRTLNDRINMSKTIDILGLTVEEWNQIPGGLRFIALDHRDVVIKAKMIRDLFKRVSTTDDTSDNIEQEDKDLADQIAQHTTAALVHNQWQLQLTRNAKSIGEYVSQAIVALRQFKRLQTKYGEAEFDPKEEKLNVQQCNYVIGQIGFQYKTKQIRVGNNQKKKVCNIIVPEFTEIAGIKFPTPEAILKEREAQSYQTDQENKRRRELEEKTAKAEAKAKEREEKKAAKKAAKSKCKYATVEVEQEEVEVEQVEVEQVEIEQVEIEQVEIEQVELEQEEEGSSLV